jgi:membrane protease YdiL (CAAX protease family)
MQSKSIVNNSGYKQLSIIIILTLIASILPQVIFREWTGSVPVVLPFVKLIILFLAGILSYYLNSNKITKYILVLGFTILAEILTKYIFLSAFWQKTFDMNSFIGNFGGSILLKIVGIIPVIGILIVLFKSPAEVYIAKGDLSKKAEEIKWLGIKEDKISWGKLTIISSLLISLGTIMLTIFTVTKTSTNLNIGNLVKYFPLVVILAILNSLCEGILFRSAILGALKNVLPKNQAIFIAAMIFGIAHYYGAPSGIVGVVMSILLGAYLSTSMYETEGFVSSWIIHFMQDVVIFTTILLLGNYY